MSQGCHWVSLEPPGACGGRRGARPPLPRFALFNSGHIRPRRATGSSRNPPANIQPFPFPEFCWVSPVVGVRALCLPLACLVASRCRAGSARGCRALITSSLAVPAAPAAAASFLCALRSERLPRAERRAGGGMVPTESWHCRSGQDFQPVRRGGSAWGVPTLGTACLQQGV